MCWFRVRKWCWVRTALLALLMQFVVSFGGIHLGYAAPQTAAASPASNWDGFYIGGHVGLGRGDARATVWDAAPTSGCNTFGGLIGGAQFGYNVVLPSHVLLG